MLSVSSVYPINASVLPSSSLSPLLSMGSDPLTWLLELHLGWWLPNSSLFQVLETQIQWLIECLLLIGKPCKKKFFFSFQNQFRISPPTPNLSLCIFFFFLSFLTCWVISLFSNLETSYYSSLLSHHLLVSHWIPEVSHKTSLHHPGLCLHFLHSQVHLHTGCQTRASCNSWASHLRLLLTVGRQRLALGVLQTR